MEQFILVVNGYKIKNEIIGKGSSGTCFRCEHDNLKQFQICVKIIDLKHEQDYNTEIKLLKKQQMIQNDYIIKIFDIIQQNNQLYIFMEEQTQGDLSALIRKRKEKEQYFKVDEVLKIIKQIARGYKILYMQQIIHRDLKPSNILQGNNGALQITDFGLCKFKKDVCQLSNNSKNGGVYFSPQIFESSTYSSKCDMYSLGAIIYELIYGKPLMDKIEDKRFFPVCFLDLQKGQQGEWQENKFLKDFLYRSLQFEEKERLSWEELFYQIDDLEIFQSQLNNNSFIDLTLSDFNCSKGYELQQQNKTTNLIKIIQFIFIKISFLEHLQDKQDTFFKSKPKIGLVSTSSFFEYSKKLLQAYSHSLFLNLYHFLFKRDDNLSKLQILKELQNNYEESIRFFIQSDDLEINNYKHYIQQFYLSQKQQLQDELKALANDQNFKIDLSIFFKRINYFNYSIFVQAFQETLKQLSKVYPNKESKEFVEYMAFSYRFLKIQNEFSIRNFQTANSQDVLYFSSDYNYLKDYVRRQSMSFN